MALVRPDSNTFARIKVLGVGGAGGNVVTSMIIDRDMPGIDFISVNTDAQALLATQAPTKLQIGEKLTKGLGSGSSPEIGRKAAEETQKQIKEVLEGSDMVFLTGGMGGGTGSGAMPIIAQIAREVGALTVAVVTKPFLFEGTRRMVVAEEAIENLKDKLDTLIVIPNQRLLEVVDQKMTLLDAFRVADSVLGQGVQGISDLITTPGLINVDFADVKTIMSNAGSALMGIGSGSGGDRAVTAARMAISSPLLEVSIDGARGVLINIIGGKDLTMTEVNEAAKMITEHADADANIIFGATIDEALNDQVKITLIATGFDEQRTRLQQLARTGPVRQQRSFSPSPFLQHEEPRPEPPRPPDQELEEPPPPDEDFPPENSELDIPAFLRQKH